MLTRAAEHALEHRAHERVVRAAEHDGVDPGGAQRLAVLADRVDHVLVEREAGLDDRRQVGARDRREPHERVGVGDRPRVRAALDGRRRGEQPDAAVAGRRHRLHGAGLDDAEHLDAERGLLQPRADARAAPPRWPSCRPPRAASRAARAAPRRSRARTARARARCGRRTGSARSRRGRRSPRPAAARAARAARSARPRRSRTRRPGAGAPPRGPGGSGAVTPRQSGRRSRGNVGSGLWRAAKVAVGRELDPEAGRSADDDEHDAGKAGVEACRSPPVARDRARSTMPTTRRTAIHTYLRVACSRREVYAP